MSNKPMTEMQLAFEKRAGSLRFELGWSDEFKCYRSAETQEAWATWQAACAYRDAQILTILANPMVSASASATLHPAQWLSICQIDAIIATLKEEISK